MVSGVGAVFQVLGETAFLVMVSLIFVWSELNLIGMRIGGRKTVHFLGASSSVRPFNSPPDHFALRRSRGWLKG